ncbi:MAG: diguanylate cyclase [Lachnospiraceae bacterium]|jgi:diguanylate cyclase (GGDEF)-like protein|nr:diguanylate cyclase [Lachnospiraceae bacterium]MCI9389151.1 diguanylate cyclase [Lachnospiraceae bacterium]MCI9471149.1 diguanylate cyclase [Lachnospiraceae bacterium]
MGKILIIDDSVVQANYLKNILDEDHSITIVHTGDEGLSYAKTGKFSLILLDVIMPGMNGFMLLKKLQEELVTEHIPVILITGLSDTQSEEQGLILGAVDYIVKPFNPLIVKARVNTHIKLYRYRQQVEHMAMEDELTKVANRRHYDQYSIKQWQQAIRLHTSFSICMFDIDKFKVYNDTFGHPAGDRVIAAVAQTAKKYLKRSTDFIARYGGEEFVAITLGNTSEAAFNYFKRIRQAVEDLHIEHDASVSPWVTISMGGVTVFPKVGDNYDTYLKIADGMLYDAKRLSRNQVVWANERMVQWKERES